MNILDIKHVEINTNLQEVCLAAKKLANATAALVTLTSAARGFANDGELIIAASETFNECVTEYNNSRSKLFRVNLVDPMDLLKKERRPLND
jgi:hypothetical protein